MTEQEKLNARILDDHFGPNRLSYSELQKKYGRSRSSIERLCRAEKSTGREYADPASKRIDPRSVAARRPLSTLHAFIGLQVLRYRTERELNYTEMGEVIGISRARVGPIEAGSYDLTLCEIQRVANVLVQPIDRLLTVAEVYAGTNG